jgi:branched-chain amino acid transport system ATP-binding protein
VVLIEHNIRFVMDLAQKIAVLNFGKLISLGTPEEVRNSEAVVSAYLGHGSPDAKR